MVQETLLWNESTKMTAAMRSKEEGSDTGTSPDPDLPPMMVDAGWVDRVRSAIPEVPSARKRRLVETCGLSGYIGGLLIARRDLADYFEECITYLDRPKEIANWVTNGTRQGDECQGP